MSLTQEQFQALCDDHEIWDEGERLFLKGVLAAGVLTEANFEPLIEAHRAGSLRTHDDLEDAKAARTSASRSGSQAGAQMDSQHEPRGQADALAEARAVVLSRQIRRTVEGRYDVRAFRQAFFADPTRRLTEVEADAVLRSPALRYLSKTKCDHLGIPLIGHEATLKSRELREGPDGLTESIDLTVRWGDESRGVQQQFTWDRRTRRSFLFRDSEGSRHEVLVRAGSCCDEVRIAAHRVAAPFEMSEEDAVWFLLTGHPWVKPALQTSTQINLSHPGWFEFATITLRIQPFVLVRTVARVYAREQRKVLGHRAGRPFERHHLQLLDFIRDRIQRPGTSLGTILAADPNQSGPQPVAGQVYSKKQIRAFSRGHSAEWWRRRTEDLDWPMLFEDWKQSTGRSYWDNPSKMRRNYVRTSRAVLFPGYIRAAKGTGSMAESPGAPTRASVAQPAGKLPRRASQERHAPADVRRSRSRRRTR